jgi:hypothetical protein
MGPILKKDSNYDPRAAPPSGRPSSGVYYGMSGATFGLITLMGDR